MITIAALQKIMPNAGQRAATFLPWLNQYMDEYGINSEERAAAFLAQIAHESGELRYVRELGNDAYLEKYDTGPIAARLGNTPADDGDGQKYRGRGLIQITGHDNYQACGTALQLDLLANPALLEQPQWAVASACWFWTSRGLNQLADKGSFVAITKRINGGTNGHADRVKYWERAKLALEGMG